MAAAEVQVRIDTTKLDGWVEFLDASIVLDGVFRDGSFDAEAIVRWRDALGAMVGKSATVVADIAGEAQPCGTVALERA